MTTSLATARTTLADALADIGDVEVYRHRLENYQYPAVLVGWPQSMDVRPYMAEGGREYVIDVVVAVAVTDPESSDELLSELIESVVEVLLEGAALDVRPVTDFGERLLADNRVEISCRLPVVVFA